MTSKGARKEVRVRGLFGGSGAEGHGVGVDSAAVASCVVWRVRA